MITVETEGSRVVVKGDGVNAALGKSLSQWFPHPKMQLGEAQVSFQSASPKLAKFKVTILQHALHLKGLLRADELFENKQQAANLYGCRP